MLLSILIPTLDQRVSRFTSLRQSIQGQISSNGLEGEVEILSLRDNGERPTGAKRNTLLAMATGDFVVFVDDDDELSPDYVPILCQALRSRPDVDCIGITGIITFRGTHPRRFVHSLRYTDYRTQDGIYTRPPYHLNPMRRCIAAAYRFREVYYSEDIDWALRIRADARLRSEVFVDSVLYYYHSRRYWAYQWLLDHTEGLRHRLGLRLTNRFQLYSLLRKGLGWKGEASAR